jgi:hypothetical protein
MLELFSVLSFVFTVVLGLFAHSFAQILSIKRITIIGFYYYMWILMLVPLLFSPVSDEFTSRYGFQSFLIASFIHPMFILIGYLLIVTPQVGVFRQRFNSQSLRVWVSLARTRRLVYYFAAACSVVMIHQFLSLDKNPLLIMLSGGTDTVELVYAREDSFKLNRNFFTYIWHFNRMVFFPFVILVAFFSYYITKSGKWLALFILLLIFGAINNAVSSALAPVALLGLLVMLSYIRVSRGFSTSAVSIMLVLTLFFPVVVEYLYSSMQFSESMLYTLKKIFGRFSFETMDRTISYFDVFPDHYGFLGGRTNALFTLFSGEEVFNVQNYIFLYRLNTVHDYLLTGSANAHFIGYMYADFGLFGVAAASLVVGLIIGLIERRYYRLKSSAVVLACYMITVTLFWKLMGSQPTTVLFSNGAILLLMMAVFFSRKDGVIS